VDLRQRDREEFPRLEAFRDELRKRKQLTVMKRAMPCPSEWVSIVDLMNNRDMIKELRDSARSGRLIKRKRFEERRG